MKYDYLIIEDNALAAQNLKIFMDGKKDFECKGIATNIKDARSLIFKNLPKLIFLDVELQNESGFILLKDFRTDLSVFPFVVMTTAHDHYAKEALNNEVLYFLSKPIDEDELNIALNRFIKTIDALKDHLVVKDHKKGHRFIKHDQIIFLKSDNMYTHIKLDDGEKITASKSLKSFEEYMPKKFLRIHRQYMLNTAHIHTIKLNERQLYFKNPENGHDHIEENFLPIGENFVDNLKNLVF